MQLRLGTKNKQTKDLSKVQDTIGYQEKAGGWKKVASIGHGSREYISRIMSLTRKAGCSFHSKLHGMIGIEVIIPRLKRYKR